MSRNKLLLEYCYEYEPVKVNALYHPSRGRRGIYKDEKAGFQTNVIIVELLMADLSRFKEIELKFCIDWYGNFYNKNGTIKTVDEDGIIKPMQDDIFKAVRLNDKQVFDLRVRKVQSKERKVIVKIYK